MFIKSSKNTCNLSERHHLGGLTQFGTQKQEIGDRIHVADKPR